MVSIHIAVVHVEGHVSCEHGIFPSLKRVCLMDPTYAMDTYLVLTCLSSCFEPAWSQYVSLNAISHAIEMLPLLKCFVMISSKFSSI